MQTMTAAERAFANFMNRWAAGLPALSEPQARVVKFLQQEPMTTVEEITERLGVRMSTLRALVRKGVVALTGDLVTFLRGDDIIWRPVLVDEYGEEVRVLETSTSYAEALYWAGMLAAVYGRPEWTVVMTAAPFWSNVRNYSVIGPVFGPDGLYGGDEVPTLPPPAWQGCECAFGEGQCDGRYHCTGPWDEEEDRPVVADTAASPEADTATSPEADTATSPEASASAKPLVDTSAKPLVDTSAKPKADPSASPIVDAATKAEADAATKAEADASANPIVDITSPIVDAATKAEVGATAKLVADTSKPEADAAKSLVDTSAKAEVDASKSVADTSAKAETGATAKLVADAATKPEVGATKPEAGATKSLVDTAKPETGATTNPESAPALTTIGHPRPHENGMAMIATHSNQLWHITYNPDEQRITVRHTTTHWARTRTITATRATYRDITRAAANLIRSYRPAPNTGETTRPQAIRTAVASLTSMKPWLSRRQHILVTQAARTADENDHETALELLRIASILDEDQLVRVVVNDLEQQLANRSKPNREPNRSKPNREPARKPARKPAPATNPELSPAQRHALAYVRQYGAIPVSECQLAGIRTATLYALTRRGLLTRHGDMITTPGTNPTTTQTIHEAGEQWTVTIDRLKRRITVVGPRGEQKTGFSWYARDAIATARLLIQEARTKTSA